MFVERTLSTVIKTVANTFPVILVTGPRQVGKTTLLQMCAGPSVSYVSLDTPTERILAQQDPALFLQRYKPPVIIDEVQYAPELFTHIKIAVDKAQQPGMYWLTGSQKFRLMRNVSESLAGRIAILDLLGLSNAEIDLYATKSQHFLPTPEYIENTRKYAKKMDLMDVYTRIWQGSFPRVALKPQLDKATHHVFYDSYLQTYIERDVRDLTQVGNEASFLRFLRATAVRTGQLLNLADLARDVDIDHKTAKSWLSILETSGLVYLLQPYHTNLSKRLVKAPKLYFLDTGLCCHLARSESPESLEAGPMSGAILETFMFIEILKSYWHNGYGDYFYFYRDKDLKEIDLILEQDGKFYLVEFKKTTSPSLLSVGSFTAFKRLGKPIGHSAIICLRETDIPLSSEVEAIPVSYL